MEIEKQARSSNIASAAFSLSLVLLHFRGYLKAYTIEAI